MFVVNVGIFNGRIELFVKDVGVVIPLGKSTKKIGKRLKCMKK